VTRASGVGVVEDGGAAHGGFLWCCLQREGKRSRFTRYSTFVRAQRMNHPDASDPGWV
jgi:hypothetical protein